MYIEQDWDTNCTFVVGNFYGHHQPELMAQYLLNVEAEHPTLSREDLELLARDYDELNDDERDRVSNVLTEDLYVFSFKIDGEAFYFWTSENMDVWMTRVGFDPDAEAETEEDF